MTIENPADALRLEIQRVDAIVRPIGLAELEARTTPNPMGKGWRPPAHAVESEWLVRVTEGDQMAVRPHRWRTLAVLAAVVLVAVAGALVFASNDGDDPRHPAVMVDDDAAEESSPQRSALQIVEQRYQAMNRLDFEAIDADIAEDATYCRLPPAQTETFEGCLDGSTGFYGPDRWAQQIEVMLLRAHAYGGAIEYQCSGEDARVVCSQRETHLLLEAADTEYQPHTFIYETADGKITHIEEQPPVPRGLIDSQVRSQEFAYVGWLEEAYPDEVDALTVSGRPSATGETAKRHRQLVTEWWSTISPLEAPDSEAGAVVDAGTAADRGWTWSDLDRAALGRSPEGFLGQLSDGRYVTSPNGRSFACTGCAIYLGAGRQWVEKQLEPFDGQVVEGVTVRLGQLWLTVGDGDGNKQTWTSADAESWDRVSLDSSAVPDADRPEYPFVFEVYSGGGQRFLRHRDRIITISYEGWLSWSADQGRTFSTVAMPGGGGGRLHQAWANNDGFFVAEGDQLWESQDGEHWTVVGAMEGRPRWERGIEDYAPDSYVVSTNAKELFTVSIAGSGLRIHQSADGGITWTEIPPPYPFEGQAATVGDGWIVVGTSAGNEAWATNDGRNWYSFESIAGDVRVDFTRNSAGVVYRLAQQGEGDRWQFAIPPPG